MHLIIGLGIAVLLITAYVISTVSKLKDNSAAIEQVARELMVRLQSIEGRLEETERTLNEQFTSMRKEQKEDARFDREEQSRGMVSFGDSQAKRIKEIGDLQRESLNSFSRQLADMSRLNEEKLEAMRGTVEKKLLELSASNEEKLEKMSATVDEKLHETLE